MLFRGLVLLAWFLPGIARRSTRIGDYKTKLFPLRRLARQRLQFSRAAPTIHNRLGHLANQHVKNTSFATSRSAALGGRGHPVVMEEGSELPQKEDAKDCIDQLLEFLRNVEVQWPTNFPPARSPTRPGYVADPSLVTWAPFQYAAPSVRRAAIWDYAACMRLARGSTELPPLRVVLIGGMAAGKGTIAPMLSLAFRVRCIGVGALLRGEIRVGRPRGIAASLAMAAGELLPDDLVLQMLKERLGGNTDAARNGWLLDGFPRSVSQAEAIVHNSSWAGLRPDVVVLIERPDELAREFALGRWLDPATGQTYHPVYAPPAAELQERLLWRVDDTYETFNRRLAYHRSSVEEIVEVFESAGIPLRRFDNARSEIETFAEVATFLEGVAMDKLLSARSELVGEFTLDEVAETMRTAAEPEDVEPYCSAFETENECLSRFQTEQTQSLAPDDAEVYCDLDESESECALRYQEEFQVGPLLSAVQRCNSYELSEFTPVLVDEKQVGWLNPIVLEALTTQLAIGRACELVEASQLAGAAAAAAQMSANGVAVRIAPESASAEGRSDFVAALVKELEDDGIIPRAKLPNELEDVHPLSAGFVVAGKGVVPLLRIGREAMIYFGIPAYGVHVNGWVRDPENPSSDVPWAMWVATRSMSKATYPGLLDQVVAGSQPQAISLDQNVREVCEQEACLPPAALAEIKPAGLVSYRYATPKWLSTRMLMVYDLEMEQGLVPLSSDGEVEEFQLLRIDEVLRSLREDLPLWKPNSALIAIDFCVRHHFVDEAEPGYAELVRLLDQKLI